MTVGRAALVAGLIAVAVYGNAYRNRWAVDDVGVVQDNALVHSIGSAWGARFSPYWPLGGLRAAGQYRPAVILSYGADWAISGGSPTWFHVVNVLLHGFATVLVVLVLARWLGAVGGLAAGIVFAVHPVHVEAVANVVGRAESMAAIGVLGAVLAARRYRAARSAAARGSWGAAVLALAAFGMFSKESAVIAIAVIALDHVLEPREERLRDATRLYLALGALTLSWLFLWRAVASRYTADNVAVALRGLGLGGRLATMLPAYLQVLRLLTVPLDLSYNYDPQVIPQRLHIGAPALIGVASVLALLVLAILIRRKAPGVTFAIAVAALSYAPTSNLLFASGVVLGERTLYLAAIAPAAALGYVVARAWGARVGRPVLAAAGVLLAVYTVRTVTRTPVWRDNPTIVVDDVIAHPESYRIHLQIARVLERSGNSSGALAEFLLAGRLFPGDPFVPIAAASLAQRHGWGPIALHEAQRAYALRPDDPGIARTLVQVLSAQGRTDSALAVARRAVERAPASPLALQTLRSLAETTGAPSWELELVNARAAWLDLRLHDATLRLRVAADGAEHSSPAELRDLCWALSAMTAPLRALAPDVVATLERVAARQRVSCDVTTPVS